MLRLCRAEHENVNDVRPVRSRSDAIYAVHVAISKGVFTSVHDIGESSSEILYMILVFVPSFEALKSCMGSKSSRKVRGLEEYLARAD